MTVRRPTLRELTLLLLSIAASWSIYSTWLQIRDAPAIDFYQFWVVGQEVAGGQPGDVYSDSERREIGRRYLDQARSDGDRARFQTARHREVVDTFSTPFLYSVFGALSSGDYDRDLTTYRALGLMLLALSVATLCRLLGYGLAATLVWMILFLSWFAPSRSDFLVGNVNAFQLGWLVLFLWLSCRFPTVVGYLAGGFVLGLGAMFKPNTMLVIGLLGVAWLVGRRHQKFLLESSGIAAGMLVAFAWSSAAFGGASIWQSWFSALSQLPDDLITVALGNYAPARLIAEWIHLDTAPAIAVVCMALALAAIGRGLWGPAPAPARNEPGLRGLAGLEDIHVAALAGLITLLASPLAWLHYFVSAIPMLLVTLPPAMALGRKRAPWIIARVAAFVALLAIMVQPLLMIDLVDTRGLAVFLCLGTVLLFALGLRELVALRGNNVDRA